MWGVDPQINRDGRDAFVGACYPVSLRLNFRPHFIKIHKLLSFAVQEFGIFYNQGQSDIQEKGGGCGEKRTERKEERERTREYSIKDMRVAGSRQ